MSSTWQAFIALLCQCCLQEKHWQEEERRMRKTSLDTWEVRAQVQDLLVCGSLLGWSNSPLQSSFPFFLIFYMSLVLWVLTMWWVTTKGKLFYHISCVSRVWESHRISSTTFSIAQNLLCFCKMVQGFCETGKAYSKGSCFFFFSVVNSVLIYKQKHWGFRELVFQWDSRCQPAGVECVNSSCEYSSLADPESTLGATHYSFLPLRRGKTSAVNSLGWAYCNNELLLF